MLGLGMLSVSDIEVVSLDGLMRQGLTCLYRMGFVVLDEWIWTGAMLL